MKVAVSIPDPVFEAAERLAKARNMPRSQLYAEALDQYLEIHGPDGVTRALNAVYPVESSKLDPALEHAQFRSVKDETW